MARLINGIFGGIKGRIGDVEGYHRFGIPHVRIKKRKTNIPPSEKQKEVRLRLEVVNKFIGTMTKFVKMGFELAASKDSRTSNNAAKSYQLLHSLKGEYPDISINYSAVMLSSGPLPPAIDPQIIALEQGIQFTWGFDPEADHYDKRAQVMMLVHCPALNKSFYSLSGARRTAGLDVLEVPSHFRGNQLEAYISFVSDDRKSISDSVYVGSIRY